MATQVQIEGIGQVEFPDAMSEADIASTIASNLPNWRQSNFAPETPSFGQQLKDAAVTTGKALTEPVRAIGQSVGYLGGITGALAKDVMGGNVLPSARRAGLMPNLENVGAFMQGRPQPANEELTPTQQGVATGVKMLPAVALATAGQLAGIPASYTLPFLGGAQTFAETGSPVQAGLTALSMAPIGKLQTIGMEGASKVMSGAIKRFAESATGDVEETLARNLANSRVAQKAVETAVGNATVQAYLEALRLPEWLQASPEKKQEMLASSATQLAGFSLLQLPYFKGTTLSQTQKLIAEDVPFVVSHIASSPEAVDYAVQQGMNPRNAQVFVESRKNLPSTEGGQNAVSIRQQQENRVSERGGASPIIQTEGIDRNIAPVEPTSSTAPGSSDIAAQGGQVAPQAQSEITSTSLLEALARKASPNLDEGKVFALSSDYTPEAILSVVGDPKLLKHLVDARLLVKTTPGNYALNHQDYFGQIEDLKRRGFIKPQNATPVLQNEPIVSQTSAVVPETQTPVSPSLPYKAAAIKIGDKVFTGPSHPQAYEKALESGDASPGQYAIYQHGFIDQKGVFIPSLEESGLARLTGKLAPTVEEHLQQLGVPRTAPVEVVTSAVQKLAVDAQNVLDAGGTLPEQLAKELGVIEAPVAEPPLGKVEVLPPVQPQPAPQPAFVPPPSPPKQVPPIAPPASIDTPSAQAKPFDTKQAKAQKKYLLTEIDKAIAEAPEGQRELAPEPRKSESGEAYTERVQKNAEVLALNRSKFGTITIDIPGDGSFDIVNERGALLDFKNRAKSFPVATSKISTPSLPSILPTTPTPIGDSSKENVLKAVSAFVAPASSERGPIKAVWSDGSKTVATNGMTMIVISHGVAGSGEAPVTVDISGNLVDYGAFPKWPQVVPKGSEQIFKSIDTTRLMNLVRQASAMSGERPHNSIKLIRNDDGSMALTSNTPELGSYVHNLGPSVGFTVAIDPEFLMNALIAARRLGQDKVSIWGKDELSPIEVRAKGVKVIIMPMRLSGATVPVPLGNKPVDSQYIIDQVLRTGGGDTALRAVVPQLRIRYGPLGEGVPMDYENGVITINKPLLDMIAARWPYQSRNYIERLFSEELIHAVADRVVPPEDYVAIAQEMSPKEVADLLRDRPDIDATINLGQRLYQMGGEHFRRVLQRELMGETTEETLPRIDPKTPLGQRIIAALRRVWEYLRDLISRLGASPNFVLNQALEKVRQTLADLEAGKPLKPLPLDQGTDLGPLNAKSIKEAIRTFAEKPNALETMRVAQAGEVVAANPTARRLIAETQALAQGPEKTVQATTSQERLKRDIARATLAQPIIRNQLVGPIDTLNLSIQMADGDIADFERIRRDPNASDEQVSAAGGNALDTIRSLSAANELFLGEYAKERPLLLEQIAKTADKELSAMDQRDVDGTLFEQFKELGQAILDQTADAAGLKALDQAQQYSTTTIKVLKFLRETQVLSGLQQDDNRSIDDLIGYIRNNIVSAPERFPNYDGSTFHSQVVTAVGAGMDAIRNVLRIVRLSEPLRTDIEASKDIAKGSRYSQPFHKIKVRVLADIAKGNLDSAHALYEHGLVETGITLKESRDQANFHARKARQLLVNLKALDGAKDIISQLISDPAFVAQKRAVQEFMGVRDRTITKEGDTDWFDHVDPSKPLVPIVWERTLADREANVKRALGLIADYTAYVGVPDAPGYDEGRANGMKRALTYLKYYVDPSQDLALGRLVPSGVVKLADHIGAVFGHPQLIPKYSFVGATGPAYTNFNLTMVALSDVLERAVAIEKQYVGRRKELLGKAMESHGMTLPSIYGQEILNPLAASRQNFNDAHLLKVGDGIGNGHTVTADDIAYYKLIEKLQNELLQVVNNYGRHKFESAGRIFSGILLDSGKQVRLPYARGPGMLPRRFPDQLVNWVKAWREADTPEKKIDFLNQNLTRFIISYIDGVGQNDYDQPYAYRLPMKEVMRTKGNDRIRSFQDLAERITRLHNEDRDNTPITIKEATDVMLEEINAIFKRGSDLLPNKEASEKLQLEVTGGDSEFNAERKQAVMPLGMYDFGVVTDGDMAGAIRGASWPFVNAHLNTAKVLQQGFESDIKQFEADAASFGTKTVKQQAADEAAHSLRLYNWGQVTHLREMLSNYLTQIQTAVHLSANPFMMDRPHQVLQNSVAKLIVTSLVAAPSPLVRNLAGGFAQIAAFNAEIRRQSIPHAFASAGGQMIAGTFKELMFLLTHEGNPATRKLRSFMESPQGRTLTLGFAKWVMDMANERRDLHDYTAQIIGVNLNQKFWENTKGQWALWRTKGIAADVMPSGMRQWLNGLSLSIDTLANFVGHATVGYGDSRINSGAVYLTEKAESEFEEIAMRWGDKRMPNGLYPDKALARRMFGLDYGTATPATRIREWFRGAGIGPIDQLMAAHYDRVKAWKANGSHGNKPRLFSDPQFAQMVMANAEDENLSTFRSRPPLFKQSKLHSTLGILFGYPFYLFRKLLSFTNVMSNQGFLRRHGENIPLALTIAALMGIVAVLGNEVASKLIKRNLENKITGFPTLSDATTPAQAAQAVLFATADSIPIIGSAFNMMMGVGYSKGFDLNSQFLMVNLASDVMKTSKEIFQTGVIGRPLLQFASRYTFPANVLGSRLPAVSGLRDLTNARNILTMGARGTGLETKLRKPGGGISEQNYTASTPLINDAVNAIGNGDQEGFQKAYNALVEQKRAGGSLNPQSAALTALKARNPITSVFGTKPDQAELDRVFANLPTDLASRAHDTINRFDSAIAGLPRKTVAKTSGTRATQSAKPASFGLRRPKLRLSSIHLRRPMLRRLAA